MQIPIETIWLGFGANLKRFIASRVGNPQAAEDILQEVLLRIHLHLDTLQDERKLQSWIYQITRNAIADYYRQAGRAPTVYADLEFIETEEADEFRAGLAASVQQMIECLPDEYRIPLVLDLQGVPQAEIAARLGISLSGAKSRVQRARDKLRELLWECCHFEFDRLGRVMDYTPRVQCCPRCGVGSPNR
jgi:RNA polymerase sigma-70 factor (ECF subfamily)